MESSSACPLMSEDTQHDFQGCGVYHNFIVFKVDYHTNVCAFHILFIHPPVDGHLSCFYLLATVNNGMNTVAVYLFKALS